MRKTLIATILAATCALSIPAFAQVAVGGAGRIGAGVQAGGLTHGAVQAADHAGMQADRTLRHTARHARHAAHKAKGAVQSNGHAQAGADLGASTHAGAGGMNGGASVDAHANTGLDTSAAAGKAGEAGRGVGSEVRDTTHDVLQSGGHAAGAVGDAVKGINASGSASAGGQAGAETHGH